MNLVTLVLLEQLKWYGYDNFDNMKEQAKLQSEFYNKVLYSDGIQWMCYINKDQKWELELTNENWDTLLNKIQELFNLLLMK